MAGGGILRWDRCGPRGRRGGRVWGSLLDDIELEMKMRMLESMRESGKGDEGLPSFWGQKVETDRRIFGVQRGGFGGRLENGFLALRCLRL